jgi:hypothetical protein
MLALYRSTIDIVTLSKSVILSPSFYGALMLDFSRNSLPPSQKADVIRALLIILSITILIPFTDASKIYHSIRGQDTIKLYVIFNALEVRWTSLEKLLFSHLDFTYRLPIGCSLLSDKTF